jgi:hypothetical protein
MTDKLNDYLIQQAKAKYVPRAVQYLENKSNGIDNAENIQPIARYTDGREGEIYIEFEDGTIVDNTGGWYADMEELTDEDGNRVDIETEVAGWIPYDRV